MTKSNRDPGESEIYVVLLKFEGKSRSSNENIPRKRKSWTELNMFYISAIYKKKGNKKESTNCTRLSVISIVAVMRRPEVHKLFIFTNTTKIWQISYEM